MRAQAVNRPQAAPLFLACETPKEAGASLVPAPRYTRGAPVYTVVWAGRVVGEVAFDRQRDWTATGADGRQLDYWVYEPDGCIARHRSFRTRHDAVIAVRHADHGSPSPVPLVLEEPHGRPDPTT